MANFISAFKKTMGHEGGYVDDPLDAGKETYRGISRRFHPTWPGWALIEKRKTSPTFPANLAESEMETLVQNFYKDQFWDRFLGDEIPNQALAEEIFDTGVNMGVSDAVRFLQISLNKLNRNELLFNDLVEDGKMGPNTLSAFSCLKKSDIEVLLVIMNVLQGMHYIDFMTDSPIQERFARGWFKRVQINKS